MRSPQVQGRNRNWFMLRMRSPVSRTRVRASAAVLFRVARSQALPFARQLRACLLEGGAGRQRPDRCDP